MAQEIILVVDDEKEIADIIGVYLQNEGFNVVKCGSGEEAIRLVEEKRPDLIILDVLLPGLDGIETCQRIRKKSDAPVIFLSCKSEDIDKILGLRIGGDDYVTKPFNPGELIARVKAQLRRNRVLAERNIPKKILNFPGMSIDLNKREVTVGGEPVDLTVKGFEILILLAQNPDRVFTYEQITRLVWNTDPMEYDIRNIMVHISHLRKKIEPNPQQPVFIKTIRGVGYRFGKTPI